ncbi:hypothetical protein [Streptomyces kaempferi]|uniref:Uncharacterized protein n=1 Tax=Streptomyces kaempferi TaxID=333725 RepID=A0ABW3XKY9_9ACTN
MDDPERYRVALTLDGRPAMRGWWASEDTARRQFSSWVGERGSMPGVHIALVDTTTNETLTEWPTET